MAEFWAQVGTVFQTTWFIIIPITFWLIFKSLWMRYVCILDFYGKQNEVLLEIIPPREIEKSPKVMERFFDALAATDAGVNKVNEYCHCAGNPFFSLEIVGTEGMAHFYIRTPGALRGLIESSLYAQYPDVEIIEVEDYVNNVPLVIPNKEWTLKGFDLALLKPDAYPIKTYQYFEEDVTGKMIDPLASMIEAMGNLGPGQHVWLQYIIRAERPQWFESWGKVTVDEFIGRSAAKIGVFERFWHDVKDIFGNIFSGMTEPPEFSSLSAPESSDDPIEFSLTPGQKQVLKALEENISKPMFVVTMRLVVLGKKDTFSGVNIAGAMTSIKQFSDNWTNQFVPIDRSKVYADYISVDKRSAYRARKLLTRYRDRDDSGYPFYLSTAELATVFHLPDSSVESPSLQRADSRFGGAPTNLPLG